MGSFSGASVLPRRLFAELIGVLLGYRVETSVTERLYEEVLSGVDLQGGSGGRHDERGEPTGVRAGLGPCLLATRLLVGVLSPHHPRYVGHVG